MSSSAHTEVVLRIHSLLAYIEEHLAEDLSLQQLASVAHYSPYHLHRLFLAVSGERCLEYVLRKRLEKAALLLLSRPEQSLSTIAYACGFQSDSNFSRAFRRKYGMSPTAYRKLPRYPFRKKGQEESKIGQEPALPEEYVRHMKNLKEWMQAHASTEVVQLPEMHLLYLSQIGEEGIEETFLKLLGKVIPAGLLEKADTHVCRLFHDSFKLTDADKVRMSIGLCSPAPLPDMESLLSGKVKGGKYLKAHFLIRIDEYETAWNALFLELNEQKFRKADGFPLEIYYNDYRQHPEKLSRVDFLIPLE